MENEHIGSTFDFFLEEEGILDECNEVALKRIQEWIDLMLQETDALA